MFYGIFDEQLGKMRSEGLNSHNKESVRKELIDYLLLGKFSIEGEESIKSNSLEELCSYYEFSLIESKTKIKYDL